MAADWDDVSTQTLRRMWAAGCTAARIADALNARAGAGVFSRNACIGKAHRLLLDSRPSPIKEASAGTLERKRKTATARAVALRSVRGPADFLFAARPKQAQTTPSVQAQLDLVVPPKTSVARESDYVYAISRNVPTTPFDGNPVTLADIGPRACRYIVGNEGQGSATLMCGAPGHPWCAGHRVRVSGFRAVAPAEVA